MVNFRHRLGQLRQDTIYLRLFIQLQLPKLVVEIDDSLRFYKKRRPTATLVVNDARHSGLVLLLYRYHISSVPHSHDGILKYSLINQPN